jgi:hypothetical protein
MIMTFEPAVDAVMQLTMEQQDTLCATPLLVREKGED